MPVSGTQLRAGRAVIEFSLLDSRLQRQLKNLNRRFAGLGRTLTRVGTLGLSSSGGFGALFGLLVGSQASRALAFPIRLAAQLEVVQAQFTALTGDAEAAGRIIRELEEFSKISIVPLPEIEKAAALLLGYGASVESVVPATQALTKVSRGNAVTLQRLALAYGQVLAKQQLYAQENRQFAESGLPLLQTIMEATGESITEVQARMANGAISADEVTRALVRTTSAGGRFGTILEQVGGTVQGLAKRLGASLTLGIRPLGQVLLPTLREGLEQLNAWAPAITEIIKKNAAWYATLLGGVGVLATTLGLITASGLAVQVLAFATGGLLKLTGLLTGTFALLTSPTGALAAAVVGLGAAYARNTESGRAWVRRMGGLFGELREIAVGTVEAIGSALAAGDLEAAGEVAMAGLNAAWRRGTDSLLSAWIEFKFFFNRVTLELVAEFEKAWVGAIRRIEAIWEDVFGEPGTGGLLDRLAGAGSSLLDAAGLGGGPLGLAGQAARSSVRQREDRLNEEIDRLRAEVDRRIEGARRAQDEDFIRELEAHRKSVREAREAWEAARDAAMGLAPESSSLDFGAGRFADPSLLGGGASEAVARALGTFNGRFAQQLFADQSQTVAEEQRDLLASIDGNIQQQNELLAGGLGPLVV